MDQEKNDKLITSSDLDPSVQDHFVVPNPKYYKLLKMGKDIRFTSKLETLNNGLYYPFGALYLGTDKSIQIPLYKDETSIKLRAKQVPVFEKVKREKGALIYARTGAGKTVINIALHEVHGGKSIILCHSLDHVLYYKESFQEFLGIDAGMYCTGKKEIKDVTITTHTTFRKDYKLFADHVHEDGTAGFDNLYVDECDRFFTKKAREAICGFPAWRKMGFTGTIKTDFDEHTKAADRPVLETFYGLLVVAEDDDRENPLKDIFYKVYYKTYRHRIGRMNKEIIVGGHDWEALKPMLDEDRDRKIAMLDFIIENTVPTDSSLILFDRVGDVELFHEAAQKRKMNSYMSHGKVPKKEREANRNDFYEKGGYMFAQHMTMGRGYDNDKLNKAFIMFPTKQENQVRQIMGRVIREFKGKESYAYWWVDTTLMHQHEARVKVFKEHFGITPTEI